MYNKCTLKERKFYFMKTKKQFMEDLEYILKKEFPLVPSYKTLLIGNFLIECGHVTVEEEDETEE